MKYLFLILLIGGFNIQISAAQKAEKPTAADTIKTIEDAPFVNMTDPVIVENGKVLLQWNLAGFQKSNSFFLIERSRNGEDFESVASIKIGKSTSSFSFIDQQPLKGGSYYRICYVDENSNIKAKAKYITVVGNDFSYKFYPNPVENMLIVKADTATIVEIIDKAGVSKFSLSLNSGVNVLDVSTLQKGSYYIKFTQTLTGKRFTDELVKH